MLKRLTYNNIYVIPKSNKKLQTFPLCLQNSFLSKQYEPRNCRFDWQTEYWNLIGCGQNNRTENCLQSGVSISVVKTLVNGGYTSRLTLWLWTLWLCISCYKSLLTHVFAKLLELWGEMFCSLNSFPCYYEWIKIIKFAKQFSSSIYRICINILSWKQEKFAKTLVSWSLM